jgi:putative ABC transport system permease protein
LSNLLFTLVPAWKASGTSCVDGLQSTSRHATDSVRRQRLRSTLVAVQIAVAVVLLTGAGLLIRSFTSALANNLGADTSHVLTFDFRYPPREAFKQIGMHGTSGLFEVSAKPADMVDRVSERLRHVAGVEAVGAVSLAPFSGPGIQMPFSIEGRTLDTGAASTADSLPVVEYFAVTPGFFGTMRVPLRQGRDFVPTDDERSRSVVIVNETFARQYFRGEEAIGRYLRLHFLPEEPVREVVGVVADVLSGRMESQRSPTVYVPNRQQSSRFVGPYVYTRNGMYFVVRTTADPGGTIEIVKRAVAEVDPVTPVANARPVEQTLDDQVRFLRLYTLLLSAFGGVAALLAAVGIYGVAACNGPGSSASGSPLAHGGGMC